MRLFNEHAEKTWLRVFPIPYQMVYFLFQAKRFRTLEDFKQDLKLCRASEWFGMKTEKNGKTRPELPLMSIDLQPESAYAERYTQYVGKSLTTWQSAETQRALANFMRNIKASQQASGK